jgi:DtxR family transcriptional regulator, Mn-dependent transcriptional regulator
MGTINRNVTKSGITSNMEDYLEAIYEIEMEATGEEVRVKDIAKHLKVTRPSVVGMMKHLVEHDLVLHNRYAGVKLTKEGRYIAKEMLRRHRIIRRFLEDVLGLDAEIAEEDACNMEHALSEITIDRFIALEEFRNKSPEIYLKRGESFRKFLKDRKHSKSK